MTVRIIRRRHLIISCLRLMVMSVHMVRAILLFSIRTCPLDCDILISIITIITRFLIIPVIILIVFFVISILIIIDIIIFFLLICVSCCVSSSYYYFYYYQYYSYYYVS